MRLRTRLALALLGLAVVPLAGITAHGYWSSRQAYERGVQAEANALAEEMGSRLGGVTADLNRRLADASTQPGPEFTGNGEVEYADFARRVERHLGPAADYLELLEVVPPPPPVPPAPPVAIAPSTPATPGVEALPSVPARTGGGAFEFEVPGGPGGRHGGHWKMRVLAPDAAAIEKQIEAARLALHEKLAQVEGTAAAQLEAEDRQLAQQERQLHQNETVAELAQNLAEAEARGDEAEARALERAIKGAALGFLTRAGREVVDLGAHEAQQRVRKAFQDQVTIAVPKGAFGELRAHLRTERVLDDVLKHTRRNADEVPFAMNESGELFAAEQDKPALEKLVKEVKAGSSRAVGDWVVALHGHPGTGLKLGIARPLGAGLRELRKASLTNLGYGLAMIALALVGTLPLSRRLTRDLAELTHGAERLAGGDLAARVPARSSDEVGRLARTFNHMAEELQAQQGRLVEQERLKRELELCRQIQEQMLPKSALRSGFAEVQGVSVPAREVGGDFFNYFFLADGREVLLVGDVSGKGVPAALLMARVQASLRAQLPLESELTELLERLDHEVESQATVRTYLTLFVAILDPRTSVLRYVNAGHNPPLLLRADGSVLALDPTGRPAGLYPGGGYEQRELAVGPNDCLLLYTDGVVESEGPTGEAFGVARLQSFLTERPGQPIESLLHGIEAAVVAHRAGGEAQDDATLVFLRIAGASAA